MFIFLFELFYYFIIFQWELLLLTIYTPFALFKKNDLSGNTFNLKITWKMIYFQSVVLNMQKMVVGRKMTPTFFCKEKDWVFSLTEGKFNQLLLLGKGGGVSRSYEVKKKAFPKSRCLRVLCFRLCPAWEREAILTRLHLSVCGGGTTQNPWAKCLDYHPRSEACSVHCMDQTLDYFCKRWT